MDSERGTAQETPTAAALERRARRVLGTYLNAAEVGMGANAAARADNAAGIAHLSDAVQRLGDAVTTEARRPTPAAVSRRVAALEGALGTVVRGAEAIADELDRASTPTSTRLAARIRREVIDASGLSPVQAG